MVRPSIVELMESIDQRSGQEASAFRLFVGKLLLFKTIQRNVIESVFQYFKCYAFSLIIYKTVHLDRENHVPCCCWQVYWQNGKIILCSLFQRVHTEIHQISIIGILFINFFYVNSHQLAYRSIPICIQLLHQTLRSTRSNDGTPSIPFSIQSNANPCNTPSRPRSLVRRWTRRGKGSTLTKFV